MYISLKNISGGLTDCATAAQVLGVMQKKVAVLWKRDATCTIFQNPELALWGHMTGVSR